MTDTARLPFPLPPIIFLIALIAGVVLGILYPLPWFGDVLGDILFGFGWLAALGAVALWFAAIRMMFRARTPLNPVATPTHLLTGGPFGISRNPIYLSLATLVVGIGLITGNIWLILLAFVAGLLTSKLVIQREEKTLAGKFGKKYHDYAKRVRRWI
ncbi:isoprenylcysteine carboxylmethyltransferase family protein [Mesorhizobium sp. 1M-11]|uniref:methyltransferase family protein n=1 Tax=Mesorhizobium sp. 1M-11 TaxID=1529006 RepID=UPI0006C757C7|nr:isoprenylcysteine carboxylmethyltransferase family protein [Mesorhizobium sp. 1M-11]